MKTALITFRNVNTPYDGEAEKRLIWVFNKGGLQVDYVYTLSTLDDLAFNKIFGDLAENVDNIVILAGGEVSFDIKEIICKKFNLQTEENENAGKFINEYEKLSGQTAYADYMVLPEGSTVIPNLNGFFQGYTLSAEGCTVTVLPDNPNSFESMCINFVLPYFEQKYKTRYDNLTLKCFGVTDSVLQNTLAKAKQIAEDKITFNVERKNSDVKVSLVYNNNTPRILTDDAVRYIVTQLQGKIYAEEDCALEKRLFDLLNLHRLNLSVAESFTAGRVVSSVIKVPGASAVINEGVVAYSNHAKHTRLGVNERTIKEYGAVSKETAYEMATGLLRDDDTDIAIATTGIAGPKSDDSQKPVGLCYIAVGDRDGVHIHKYVFKGDREQITETAKNASLFLAIKHIKERM